MPRRSGPPTATGCPRSSVVALLDRRVEASMSTCRSTEHRPCTCVPMPQFIYTEGSQASIRPTPKCSILALVLLRREDRRARANGDRPPEDHVRQTRVIGEASGEGRSASCTRSRADPAKTAATSRRRRDVKALPSALRRRQRGSARSSPTRWKRCSTSSRRSGRSTPPTSDPTAARAGMDAPLPPPRRTSPRPAASAAARAPEAALQRPPLLLDEPHHLDAESVAWLERFRRTTPAPALAVTRSLLPRQRRRQILPRSGAYPEGNTRRGSSRSRTACSRKRGRVASSGRSSASGMDPQSPRALGLGQGAPNAYELLREGGVEDRDRRTRIAPARARRHRRRARGVPELRRNLLTTTSTYAAAGGSSA